MKENKKQRKKNLTAFSYQEMEKMEEREEVEERGQEEEEEEEEELRFLQSALFSCLV